MGMYTEISLRLNLKSNTPKDVIELLQYMSKGSFYEQEAHPKLPDHALFLTNRWMFMLYGSSYYHIPFACAKMEFSDISGSYSLVSRSDFKNYDNEVEKFFDWIAPYTEDGMMGYSLYEEDDAPVVYWKQGEEIKKLSLE